MADSTKARSRRKAESGKHSKPYKDFPLFPHARGYWAKKVRQKLEYFGKIADDPQGQAAYALWEKHKHNLLAGRSRREDTEGLTVEDLCDRFLNAKRPNLATGELTKRSFDEYFSTCERLIKAFGRNRLVDDLQASDFEDLRASIAKTWGKVRLANEISRVRSVFKYGFEAELYDRAPRFGPQFKKPNRKTMRLERLKKPPRLYEPAEIKKLVKAASVQMQAMILLGINCGFGNSDCARLPISALDLKGGWVDFPRPKTGIPRRCKLWGETVAALKAAIAKRPKPKDPADNGLVFVTKYGSSWAAEAEGGAAAKEIRKLLDTLGIYRPGLGFYALRHTFETIGGDSLDQVAVDSIMGHAPKDSDMGGVYRERRRGSTVAVGDDRLQAVAEHVRRWLYPPEKKPAKAAAKRKGGAK